MLAFTVGWTRGTAPGPTMRWKTLLKWEHKVDMIEVSVGLLVMATRRRFSHSTSFRQA